MCIGEVFKFCCTSGYLYKLKKMNKIICFGHKWFNHVSTNMARILIAWYAISRLYSTRSNVKVAVTIWIFLVSTCYCDKTQ